MNKQKQEQIKTKAIKEAPVDAVLELVGFYEL